ncbi:MAG: hypothetical protein AB8B64_11460 [Granulosicoccus sp.]
MALFTVGETDKMTGVGEITTITVTPVQIMTGLLPLKWNLQNVHSANRPKDVAQKWLFRVSVLGDMPDNTGERRPE